MIRLGILGSTRGTHLQAIVDAIRNKELSASIEIVISNKKDAGILSRAQDDHMTSTFIDPTGLSRAAYDEKVSACLNQHHVDLVVLIGYMRILSDAFVATWQNKIINVHPSLLPAFAGMMDLDVHRAVINAKVRESGCTVHYVTAEVDAGPILLQSKCDVLPNDTAESLKMRVQQLEGVALVTAIRQIANSI